MSSMYPSFGGAPSRPCARCGAPLTINETQCSRCGLYNPLPQQGQSFGAFPQGAPGGPGPSGPLWGGSAPQNSPYQPSGNGAWSGNQDASASAWGSRGQQGGGGWPQNNAFGGPGSAPMQSPNAFGSNFANPNQSAYSNFGQGAQPSAFNNSFGGSSFGQSAERPSVSSFFQATQQNGYGEGASPLAPNRPAWLKKPGEEEEENEGKGKNRPSANVILVIIILLVALIGGAGYGGYYLYKHRSPAPTASTTGNAAPVVTPNVAPLFSDSFKSNANNWNTNPGAGGKITLAGDGKLVLEADTAALIVPAIVPGGKTFGDLRVDVDATMTSSDPNNGYGIYIRAASAQKNPLGLYYRFEVYGDGSFLIYKGFQDAKGTLQYQSLKQSPPNNAIAHAGSTNHLTVIAQGQTLTFSVNGTTLANFTDATYKSGSVALFVSMVKSATSSAQASFQHFAIFPPQ